MRELLQELMFAIEQGRDCVFCSLVETRGSTPQKAGAAMLVFADGSQRGTLGGGCVEAEVKQRALRSMTGGPEVLTFQLDSDYGWDDGLICGGRMTVLAQPLANATIRQEQHYFQQLGQFVREGRGCTEAVLIQELDGLPAGARFLFGSDGQLVSTLHAREPSATIRSQLPSMQQRPKPSIRNGVSYLPILPRITLLIVGGGHVGQAVGKLAAEADFDIWVADDREMYASADRFPQATRRFIGDISQSLKHVNEHDMSPSMFCIIVTRGHAHDEEALYHLATTNAGYVGMIGSKRKIRLIFDDLLARGIPKAALDRVHAPLGIDIGSQTVPEIAVSIVAELIAFRNLGKSGSR